MVLPAPPVLHGSGADGIGYGAEGGTSIACHEGRLEGRHGFRHARLVPTRLVPLLTRRHGRSACLPVVHRFLFADQRKQPPPTKLPSVNS